MCGIFCSVLQRISPVLNADKPTIEKPLKELLQRRGPNATNLQHVSESKVHVLFGGSVLWQQGTDICPQPVTHEDIILLFNGDVYNAGELQQGKSDTAWLASAIASCRDDEAICTLLRAIEGPYSLVFYHKNTKCLYFCRDSLGRNSLIVERSALELRLMSTGCFGNALCSEGFVMELPPLGLYKLHVPTTQEWTLFPWQAIHDEALIQLQQIENTFKLNIRCADCIQPKWLNTDSTLKYSFNFYEINSISDIPVEHLFETLLKEDNLQQALNTFATFLEESVQHRVRTTPPHCENCLTCREMCKHAKIAILFSGGIDCSILALLTHKYVNIDEPIELINVAFERINASTADVWNTPDRLSAKVSLLELKRLCPKRQWTFVEVNVTRNELQRQLESHIKHLIYPLNTVLDESIGCAFWFASRGHGVCDTNMYTSTARVVIVGSGADELFAGYTRHRNAYKRCNGTEVEKLNNLHAELEKDWRRIPSRNLARDDRVVADNGRTLRAPFIEENLVQYVRSLSPAQRCCFRLGEGVGDKLFLRLYGYRLGLNAAAFLKKRAIQFGSRIANSKQNAAELSDYLRSTLNV